jgi:hypothetical protein
MRFAMKKEMFKNADMGPEIKEKILRFFESWIAALFRYRLFSFH